MAETMGFLIALELPRTHSSIIFAPRGPKAVMKLFTVSNFMHDCMSIRLPMNAKSSSYCERVFSKGVNAILLNAVLITGLFATQVTVAQTLPETLYVSSTSNGVAGGELSFNDEDIVAFDPGTGQWSMYFDGSDVGVTSDINAFTILPDNSILLSLTVPLNFGGDIGTADDSDIVRFIPTSMGNVTAGTFELYFDGSDVGLSTNGEDIYGLHVRDNGNLPISTNGVAIVPSLTSRDEDILEFTPTQLGQNTAGTWSIYFDGSDVELTSGSEDIWALGVQGNDLIMSTTGQFSVQGLTGDEADLFVCTPGSLGDDTQCNYSLLLNGGLNGFAGENIDALAVAGGTGATNQPPVANADSYSTGHETALTVSASAGVLSNDTDPNTDSLTAVLLSGPSNGVLDLDSNGAFEYTPNNGFSGTDSFTYRANDGTENSISAATVTIAVAPAQNQVPITNAFHRSGQTFLTWDESNQSVDYHVYRHNQPITSSNLGDATRLTDRWGPLDSNTSIHKIATDDASSRFIIEDLGDPLGDDTGLFVHTTSSEQQGNAWYAVTVVSSGVEETSIHANFGPFNESVQTPQPVLIRSENDGKGRIYTQYMDYANWNPTLNGYAYNFGVTFPQNYNPSTSYPLQVQLHAYGGSHKFETSTEFDWPVIQLFPQDPTDFAEGIIPTWWYGYSDSHDYRNTALTPDSGQIVNFTEQRVLDAVESLIDVSDFNIDPNFTYAYGNSMGASGSLSLGI